MKKLKGVIAFFVLMLMISTVTAIPINNSKIIVDYKESKLDKFIRESLSQYGDISDFKKLIYKYIDLKGVNTIIGGCEVIEQCNNYYNESDVQLALEYGEEEITDLLENINVSSSHYSIGETFDLDCIFSRIQSLHAISVLDDIKDLLQIETSYKSFNDSRNVFGQMFMADIYDDLLTIDDGDIVYDNVNSICHVIAKISLLWAIPLTILFGLSGLVVSSLITYVFFAPVTIPMTLYVSFIECINNNVDDITDQLIELALQWGLVGLITMGLPIILKMVFMTPEGLTGIVYVLDQISILSLIESKGGYDIVAGEHRPEINAINDPDHIIAGLPTIISPIVYDMDKVVLGDDSKYRDYVRVGIDWDNDMVYDEWTDFKEPENSDWTQFNVVHTFKTSGKHIVNFIAFDLMGGYSDVKTRIVNVEPRPRVFNGFEEDYPLLFFLFCIGMGLLFVGLCFMNGLLGFPFPPF